MIVEFTADHPDLAPARATEHAAGYDLRAAMPWLIAPGQKAMVTTGVRVAVPAGCVGLLFGRSSLGAKLDLRPSNCVGVIDADYRGYVKVSLRNDGTEDRSIGRGDRIAQLVVVPLADTGLQEVDELTPTERGEGGFGSTGIN